MQHIKDCLSTHKVLKRLKEKLSDSGDKQSLLSLLSDIQKEEIISVVRSKRGYVIKLKSAYALYGIKQALRNFHEPVQILIR
jgi:hypothetical protein